MESGSDTTVLLVQLATLFVQFLPKIVACIVGVALLLGVAPGDPSRRRGMIGLGLVAFAIAAHFAFGALQMVMIQRTGSGLASLHGTLVALQAVSFIVECVSAVGLVVVVSALCAALRAKSHAAQVAPPLP